MSFLNNLSEFAALLLSLLTAPFTLAGLILSVPVYLLLAHREKRQRMEARKQARQRRKQAAIEAEDRRRRLARVPTLPPLQKRYSSGGRTKDRPGT
ncbi:MAG: hypothetical protein ACFB50_15720 [Rubrobacteraceae bacterium]